MQIPSWPQAGHREAELLRAVLESPQWGGFHPFVAEFEQKFANYQQCSHGISAFNGTVTLETILTALNLKPGDEVVVPAISFVSTATAVSRLGGVPVFVDIEPHSFNMDPEQVRCALSPSTAGIIAVHFGGTMADVSKLGSIANEAGCWLIEDAAHAHGSEWEDRRAGSFGRAGSFSFQNGKVLCSGEGGMIVTSNEVLAEAARSLINQGRVAGRSFYEHHRIGTNFRMTAFQAAVLLAQFESLPKQIAHRTCQVQLLKKLLADVDCVEWQTIPEEQTQHSQYLLTGRLKSPAERDSFCAKLNAAQIPCKPFYPHTLYANPVYRNDHAPCRVLDCSNAEARIHDAFWLPHQVFLADDETINNVANEIRRLI